MSVRKFDTIVDPVDTQVGGDADIGGIAQTITEDDIVTLLTSTRPVTERVEQLSQMRSELEARENADRGEEIAPLLNSIDNALAQLNPQQVQFG